VPRARRIDSPGLIYHVFNRGVKRLRIFLDDTDRQQFLDFLYRAQNEFPFQLHCYCLMSNHYHLLLQTLNHSLSRTMQYFNGLFASWFNRKNAHVGHVFQGRFQSIPVNKDRYFTKVARYIHLNPVKAGIITRPEDYAWSNYGRMIRGETDRLADPARLLSYFGDEPAIQRKNYQRYVEENLNEPELVTDSLLQRMRYWGEPPPLPLVSPFASTK